MVLKSQSASTDESEEELLSGDLRWALVQRILASEGFQRAAQLRKILVYVCKSGILRPNDVLREFEIAYEVLGRLRDFDPANDNIVRAQVSHLRHKLQHYFETEGRDEPVVLTIPKGKYFPVFTPVQNRAPLPVISEPTPVKAVDASREASSSVQASHAPPWWKRWKITVPLSAAFTLSALLLLQNRHALKGNEERAALANPFVQFLARSEGDVTVVVPDTSLVMIQDILGADISTSDYVSNDFPQRQMAMVPDPAMKRVISQLARYRTTSANEATIAFDFLETLRQAGAHAAIRYAHDLHVRDLSGGNTILLGGRGSDPWVSLFADQINFRHVDDRVTHQGYFENLRPAPGEQLRYENIYSNQEGSLVGYVGVAFVPNPSQSGYVLVINGADMQANEAASRFLLHGRFLPEISALLGRKDLRYFELFLRGKHIAGEADDSFELVALRPR
jgi:hypothetical protein